MTQASAPLSGPARVVLVGASGYGRSHLQDLARLAVKGRVRLVGVCDIGEPDPALLRPHGEVPICSNLRLLLERTAPDVVILSTPIATHADFAVDAFEAGAAVLVEKPPAPSLVEYHRMAAAARQASRACQVGFQDLPSPALPALRRWLAGGVLGELQGIGMAGRWVRTTAYYERARWAGRRRLDGVDVTDGALVNPFAHGVAAALALDGATRAGSVQQVAVELFRAHEIEADDTACARITTARGTPIVAAGTLCAEQNHPPYLRVHARNGAATWWYKQHVVELELAGRTPRRFDFSGVVATASDGGAAPSQVRETLLENLVRHLQDPQVQLRVPLEETRAFTEVVEAVRMAPPPRVIGSRFQHHELSDGHTRRIIDGIDDVVAAIAEDGTSFRGCGVPWAGEDADGDGSSGPQPMWGKAGQHGRGQRPRGGG